MTKEKCSSQANKCTTKNEFKNKYKIAYTISNELGWLDELCKHMIPSGYQKWTKELIKEDALKYKTRNEWAQKNRKSYNESFYLNCHEECCEHMDNIYTKWTEEKLIEVVKQYSSRTELKKKNKAVYEAVRRRKINNIVYAQIPLLKKPNNFFSKEKCEKLAKQCLDKIEFRHKFLSAYQASSKNKWLKDLKYKK